jgi:hypothetical protein
MVRYKEIEGWPGYRVGDDGWVMSCKDARGRLTDNWHRLDGTWSPRGRRSVELFRRNEGTGLREGATRQVAHLVLEAFVCPCPAPGMVARYRDDDTRNNRVENLFWGRNPTWDNPLSGPDSAVWKGDEATEHAGRLRAQKRYPLGPCERCGKPAIDRHHKDSVTTHNEPSNIARLCRRCHMEDDGRLVAFVEAAGGRKYGPEPPKPCSNCGRLWKPLRRGRCGACSDYFRAHGKERSEDAVSWWHEKHGSTWNQDRPV